MSRPSSQTHLPAPTSEALSVVSVESIVTRSQGLVTVTLRLADGTRSRVVMANRNLSLGSVSVAAQAVAVLAECNKGRQ